MLNHYVEYLYSGIVGGYNTSSRKIFERNADEVNLPSNALGYRFFDSEITKHDSGDVSVGEAKNITGWHLRGEKYPLSDAILKYGTDNGCFNVLNAMRANGVRDVVRTADGDFVPMHTDDELI